MYLQDRVNAFIKLGDILRQFEVKNTSHKEKTFDKLNRAIKKAGIENPWFIENHVKFSLNSIALMLSAEELNKWIKNYSFSEKSHPKTIGVVMAGNIPMVGLHDFMCVLLSGNKFLGKLSSDDKYLMPAIAEILIEIEPGFSNSIEFIEGKISRFDAVIATGSNNTARYFEHYFGNYPNIIRKNRNGVAVLSGNESNDQLKQLAKDIFMYFGLGCRNVSKLFLPEGFNIDKLFKNFSDFDYVINHQKYMNNFDYNNAVYLVNQEKFLTNNYIILKEDEKISSPLSVVYYEFYKDLKKVRNNIDINKEHVQCIVADISEIDNSIALGKSQLPKINDYADKIDTMRFLNGL